MNIVEWYRDIIFGLDRVYFGAPFYDVIGYVLLFSVTILEAARPKAARVKGYCGIQHEKKT